VRWVLCEAAQRAKTQPPLARCYAQTAARRGTQIATVAAARKLLARCFHILREVETTTLTEKVALPGALASQHAPERWPFP
jgi:hypothetical protein